MTEIILPNKSRTKKDPVLSADWYENDVVIKEVVEGELTNTNLSGSAGITRANLAAESKPLTWYTPKAITTEQSRTNTAFGKLETADEITEVVVPENGILIVSYRALVKSSAPAAGRAALFLGASQLKSETAAQEAATTGTGEFKRFVFGNQGMVRGESGSPWASGESLAGPLSGGLSAIELDAGTYTVSVQFKATSGSVTAKERRLRVAVMGV